MTFDPTILTPYLGELAAGARLTASACALALAGGLALGTMVALMRASASGPARRFAEVYVDIFRNVPFIVQLFFLFYGLPEIGIRLDAFSTGVLAAAGTEQEACTSRSGSLSLATGLSAPCSMLRSISR